MDKIVGNIVELIGETPIVKLKNTPKGSADVYVKLEFFNPGGSVKDRIALNMIHQAQMDGHLKEGGTIVEPTSGNTGIGLALVGAALGYKVVIIMPDNYSIERRKLIQAYGAELILTPASEGIRAAIDLGKHLAKERGWFMPMQFENSANITAHEQTTAPEILAAFGSQGLDAFVAGAGTGGTISGVSHGLKTTNSKIKTFVVEPAESPVLSGGKSGQHGIQGIGVPFASLNLDNEAYDDIIDITTDEAIMTAREVGRNEGFLIGFSSGAAICAAYKVAKELGVGKRVLALCADNGERYLSTELYDF